MTPNERSADQGVQDTDGGLSLLRRLRTTPQAGAASGTPAERAESYLPDEDTLKPQLRATPPELRLLSDHDAPLVAGERYRPLAQDPRAGGPVHEEDFRQAAELRPEDHEALRAERGELLRAYFREREGQPTSAADFQAYVRTGSSFFRLSPWLTKELLVPWSVQARPGRLLTFAPHGRHRFASFTRSEKGSDAQNGGQGGAQQGQQPGDGEQERAPSGEVLARQVRQGSVQEALEKARFDTVRAAALRLFGAWEEEADGAEAAPAAVGPEVTKAAAPEQVAAREGQS